MTDFADTSVQTSELFLREALAKQSQVKRSLSPIGACYYCSTTVAHACLLFCDNYCRDDWEAEQKKLAIAGKRRPL